MIENPPLGNLGSMSGAEFLGSLVSVVITILLVVGGLYFFFQLITGGVAWIGSGGDKVKLEEARGKLFNAVIGLVLLFSAWAIITLVENVFGISILQFDIPTLGQITGGGGGGGGAPACGGSVQGSCPAGSTCVFQGNITGGFWECQ